MIIDSHCHIYDEKLKNLQNDILNNMNTLGYACVCCADNLENSLKCVELAKHNKNIFTGVGVHPECINTWDRHILKALRLLTKNKKVVAIGEIGLDYHYLDAKKANKTVKNKQISILKQQIKLAIRLNLPCIFHVRDAMQDFLQLIKDLRQEFKLKGLPFNLKGVVHSFSGSVETAEIITRLGLFIGINGIVTFKNANNILNVVKGIDICHILIETDSPYLTPEPYRGQVNRPEYVEFVAKRIAQIKGSSVEDVINFTANNAINLFGLKFD